MTYDKFKTCLNMEIQGGESDDKLADLMQVGYEAGFLDEKETLSFAIVLMYLLDTHYHKAHIIFKEIMASGTLFYDAAVWDGQRYFTFDLGSETSDDFVSTLQKSSPTAEGLLILSTHYRLLYDYDKAIEYINRSCELRMFPSNLLGKLELDFELSTSEKKEISRTITEMVSDKAFELREAPSNLEELYTYFWKEFITLEYMPSNIWEYRKSKFLVM